MVKKIPIKIDKILIIVSIFEFLSPEYLNISISLLANKLIKNNCVPIKKIKGNISNIIAGEFRRAKNKGNMLSILISLKNSSSDSVIKFKEVLKKIINGK